jgi:hypothetical protein
MSISRDKMIKNLNESVIPVLKELGFKGKIPHFRRILRDRINLLTFQFDRIGGGFVIEIANCKPEGYTMHWGEKIVPEKLTAHDVDKRKRIQHNMKTPHSSTDDWFRYDKKYLLGFGNVYKKVCEDVLSKLKYAHEYWNNGELN